MPKIDIDRVPVKIGSIYPAPFKAMADARARQALGDAAGLTLFGVNLTRLPPGAATAQRHWHEAEDELVFVVSGELVLIEDAGETLLRAGEAAAFKAGHADGHHLVNRSARGCCSSGDRHPLPVRNAPTIRTSISSTRSVGAKFALPTRRAKPTTDPRGLAGAAYSLMAGR